MELDTGKDGSLQIDWSFDDSIASLDKECKSGLAKLDVELKKPAGVARLGRQVQAAATELGLNPKIFAQQQFICVAHEEISKQAPHLAGAKSRWMASNGAFDASSLKLFPKKVLERASQDLISGLYWKHGMNVAPSMITVVVNDEGIIQFKVRTTQPDRQAQDRYQRICRQRESLRRATSARRGIASQSTNVHR
jgi:hypothetical protein